MKKTLFIGHRIIDGIIYSHTIKSIDTIFCCDYIELPSYYRNKYNIYSLEKERKIENSWTSFHIDQLINEFSEIIKELLSTGYRIIAYDIPSFLPFLSFSESIANWEVISSNLNRLVQRKLIEQSKIPTPKFYSYHKNMNWNQITELLCEKVIIQFDHTSSGNGTFLVENEIEFENLLKHINREPSIISKYYDNSIPISCNIYIGIEKNNIYLTPPSVQIIEKKETKMGRSFIFSGNDFSTYNLFENKIKQKTSEILKSVGQMLFSLKIMGIVGVDLIIHNEDVYVIEINFRLQNSTALCSLIQSDLGINNIISKIIPHSPEDSIMLDEKCIFSGAQYILKKQPQQKKFKNMCIYKKDAFYTEDIFQNILFPNIEFDQYLVIANERIKSKEAIDGNLSYATIYTKNRITEIDGTLTDNFKIFLNRFL